jgi:alpha-1,6-mannosyltransferase
MSALGARTWRRDGASAWLLLAGASSALVYGGVMQSIPLVRLYTKPLRNLNNIPPAMWPMALLAVSAMLLLFGAYALGATCAGAAAHSRLPRLLVLGAPVLFIGMLLLTYPLTSTDIYDYLFRGRMLAHYQVNTFLARPQEFPDDPLLRFVAWKHVVSAYGPLWEGASLLTARLAGERPGAPLTPAMPQLLRLLFAYKLLAMLGFLLCGAAIWMAVGGEAPARRWQATYLWLWNPLALWETVGAAHNDVWMLLPVVLALGLMRRWMAAPAQGDAPAPTAGGAPLRNLLLPIAALLLIVAGALVKFAVLMLGPAVLAAALRRVGGWRARLALVLLGGGLCAGLAAVAYAPFWSGWETLQNVRDRGDLLNVSWLAALRSALAATMPEKEAGRAAALAGAALLAAGSAWAAWAAWRRPEALPRHMLGLVLWFLLVCNPWFMPWYAVWALPLAALLAWRGRAWRAVSLLCMLACSYYVIDGLVMNELGFAQKTFGREALLAALIYGPPLLVLTWPRREATARAERFRLALCGLGMLAILMSFTWRYPLIANSGGLTDIGKLSAYGRDEFAGFVVGMAALFVLYLYGLHACRRLPASGALPIVFALGALMATALVGMYPGNAIDVFLYAARSRLLTSYGADPNATPLERFPADAWARFSTSEWADNVSPYGPLWNLVAAPITALAGDRMLVALLGFKLLMLACLLLSGWLVAHILAAAGHDAEAQGVADVRSGPAAGALLLLWNPLVLWEAVGNAHNDAVLVALLLLAILAFTTRRDSLVLPLLVAATLLKYVALLIIPLALVALWRRAGDHASRRRLALRSLGLCALTLLAGFAPFYNLAGLAQSLSEQGQVIATSPGSTLAALLDERFPHQQVVMWARTFGACAMAIILPALARLLWRRPRGLPRASFEALFALLMLATLNLRPWYIIWLVALAAILPSPWPARRVLAWSAGGLALYAFLIWVEAWWKPGPDTIHLVAILVFLSPTVLLTAAEVVYALRKRWADARSQGSGLLRIRGRGHEHHGRT